MKASRRERDHLGKDDAPNPARAKCVRNEVVECWRAVLSLRQRHRVNSREETFLARLDGLGELEIDDVPIVFVCRDFGSNVVEAAIVFGDTDVDAAQLAIGMKHS